MNLRTRMFGGFLAFIVIPLFILGTAGYLTVTHLIEKNYGEQSELTLRAIGQNVNYMFRELNNLSDSILVSPNFQQAVREIASAAPVRPGDPGDRLFAINRERDLREFALMHPAIESLTVYNLQGRDFSAGRYSVQPLPYGTLLGSPLFAEAVKRNGLPLWIAPFEHRELFGETRLYTQIRWVRDRSTMENRALLVMQFDLKDLEAIFRSFQNRAGHPSTRYLLVDREGAVIFDSDNRLIGASLQAQMPRSVDYAKSYQSFRTAFDRAESIVSVSKLDMEKLGTSPWYLVSVTSWKELSGAMSTMLERVAVLTAVALVMALIFNLFFVNRVIRSILRIVRLMRRVESGEFQVTVQERGKDETALLARGFNRLVGRVRTLLDEVKMEQERKNKAEMMLLQAQIKPHFLFNTLESINALAVQNQGRKVSQMVYRLGNMLRISIHEREEIPLRQEIEHLRSYLEIQSFRFGDLFDFTIEVPEEAMDCGILKLTLQPLVENGIQHGFDGLERKGRIRVAAEIRNRTLEVWVEDNGCGMSGETLARFRYERFGEGDKPDAPGDRSGLGVRNVADRLRIRYGVPYGLFICSGPGQGTVVKCTLPAYRPAK